MLEKISEKILEIIGSLIFILIMSMVGFGIVVGICKIIYYYPVVGYSAMILLPLTILRLIFDHL